MNRIEKFNEFLNNTELIIMIEKVEITPLSDLQRISEQPMYEEIVKMGINVIPILLKRDSIIWDIALSKITGEGLDPLKHGVSERKDFWKKWAVDNGY